MKYVYTAKARAYLIKSSIIWKLLMTGCLLSVVHWWILAPSNSRGHSVHLPTAFKHRRYHPPIVIYNVTDFPYLRDVSSDWSSDCPDDCGALHGWGICDGSRCLCYSGHGGSDCGVGIEAFYGDLPVYRNVTLRPLDYTGWDEGKDIYRYLVRSVAPNLVVEIGVWKGASSVKLARAIKDQGTGVLLAVDTWLPLLIFWNDHDAQNLRNDMQFANGYPSHYYTFLSNIVQLNLTDIVIPLPATSRIAYSVLKSRNQAVELVHIDGEHSYTDVREDIEMWWSLLRDGGILLGDDWSIAWPGVLKAVREHAGRYRLKIHVFQTKWWIYKPKN